ncbi:MAG TPA: hypothetical protein VF134_07230 [Candidatus Dormibacteraeota bacterium]
MESRLVRPRVLALDRCLQVLEDALAGGKARVDAPLAGRLRSLLGEAGLIPDHRLEGRRVERVLDDIFELQAQLLGVEEDEGQAAGA